MGLKRVLLDISSMLREEDFDYINEGGCAYFAALIAKELEKKTIPYQIAFYDWESAELEDYDQQANDSNYGLAASHVFILIGGRYYDCKGFKSKHYSRDDMMHFKWSAKQVRNFYKNGDWNTTFKEETPKLMRARLREIIKQEFKTI